MLTAYVDDVVLSGPKDKMAEVWKELGKEIILEGPKGNEENVHTFLGCIHRRTSRTIKGRAAFLEPCTCTVP